MWLGVHYETGKKVAIKIICKKQLAFDKDLSDKVRVRCVLCTFLGACVFTSVW